jgi:predicted dehydrogenase
MNAQPDPNTAVSRRRFLQTTARTALAAPFVTSTSIIGSNGQTPPNSRIHLGLIGCGGMGRANLKECANHSDVAVTAACDVWTARRDSVVAQFPKSCTPYADYRELLQAHNVDAVIIATPPHWHALQAIAACEAGKDLYLQKPMTLHLAESFAVRNAIRQHQRISQIGTQIHAGDNYRRVVETVRAGHLGKIAVARTFNVMNQGPTGVGRAPNAPTPAGLDWGSWCGPAPLIPFNPILAADSYNHSSWINYSGGWTPGMAPHIIDLPVWALELDYPLVTHSSGGRFVVQDDGDAYDHHEVLWHYHNLTLTWMSSLTNSYDFTFRGDAPTERRLGIYFHGTDATLYSNYGMHRIMAEGDRLKSKQPPPPTLPPSPGHEREWLDCIHSRKQPSCNANYHIHIDVPILLSLLSLKLGRSIRFNPGTEQIVDDPQATRLAIPSYRDPWQFPAQYLART